MEAIQALLPNLDKLTFQQKQVVAHIALGASVKEAAETLVIDHKTVAFHLKNAKDRLGIFSNVRLAHWAVAAGLVPALYTNQIAKAEGKPIFVTEEQIKSYSQVTPPPVKVVPKPKVIQNPGKWRTAVKPKVTKYEAMAVENAIGNAVKPVSLKYAQ